MLGPNFTDCPDCNGDEFDIFDWDAAIWLAETNVQITLVGAEKNPTLPFNPTQGIVIHPHDDEWIASTTRGNQKGYCTDPEALADQLRNYDRFEFHELKSKRR